MSRLARCVAIVSPVVLVGGFTLFLHAAPTRAVLNLRNEFSIKGSEIAVKGFALLADGLTVVLVGAKADSLEAAAEATEPRALRIDLPKKSATPMVTGHAGPIGEVAVGGSRIFTIERKKNTEVRVWEPNAKEGKVFADFAGRVSELSTPELTYLPTRKAVAITVDRSVLVLGDAGADPFELTHPDLKSNPISLPRVDHEEKFLACTTYSGSVVVWDLKTTKVAATVKVAPEGANDDGWNWRISDLQFAHKATYLYLCR